MKSIQLRFVTCSAVLATCLGIVSMAQDESPSAKSDQIVLEVTAVKQGASEIEQAAPPAVPVETPIPAENPIPDIAGKWDIGSEGFLGLGEIRRVADSRDEIDVTAKSMSYRLRWCPEKQQFLGSKNLPAVLNQIHGTVTVTLSVDENTKMKSLTLKRTWDEEGQSAIALFVTNLVQAGIPQERVNELYFDVKLWRRRQPNKELPSTAAPAFNPNRPEEASKLSRQIEALEQYKTKLGTAASPAATSAEADANNPKNETIPPVGPLGSRNRGVGAAGRGFGGGLGDSRFGGVATERGGRVTPTDRIQTQDILLIETKDGLSAYSMSLGKWDSIVVALPKDGKTRLQHSTLSALAPSLAVVVVDDQLFGFSSKAGRWGKPIKIPAEYVGKVTPTLEGNLASAKIGEQTFTLSLKTGEWTSPDSPSLQDIDPATFDNSPAVPINNRLHVHPAEQKLQSRLDTTESRRLVAEITMRDKRSEELADQIRMLKKAISDDPKLSPKPLEAYLKDLRVTLAEAFDLKHQLEQLRVRELQSRLSRLEQQIGQRQSQRTQIIERRAHDLIEGEATEWNTDPNFSAGNPDKKLSFTDPTKDTTINTTERNESDSKTPRRQRLGRNRANDSPDETANIVTGIGEPFAEIHLPGSSTIPSYKDFAISLEEARHELQNAKHDASRFFTLWKKKSVEERVYEKAKQRLETAERKQQILQDALEGLLRDMNLRIEFYHDELKEAQKLFDTTDAEYNAGVFGSLKPRREAEHQLRQTQMEEKRLQAQYEDFKKLRESSDQQEADGKQGSLMVPPGLPADQNSQAKLQQLGLSLQPLPATESWKLEKSRHKRGMSIAKIEPGSPAERSGVHAGDILIGLEKWETASIENVIWILNYVDHPLSGRDNGPIRYLIVRDGEEREGFIKTTTQSSEEAR